MCEVNEKILFEKGDNTSTLLGKCFQRVDLDGELFKNFLETKGETPEGVHERGKILTRLAREKEGTAQRIKKENVIRFRTNYSFMFMQLWKLKVYGQENEY